MSGNVYHLEEFAERYSGLMRVVERSIATRNLPLVEARVLLAIAAQAGNSAGLCRELAMDSGQVSRLIASLERKGLVNREPDPANKKSQLLRLTLVGEEQASRAAARRNDVALRILESMAPNERASFYRACRNLGDYAANDTAIDWQPNLRPMTVNDVGPLIEQAVSSNCDHGPKFDGTFATHVCRIFGEQLDRNRARHIHQMVCERAGQIAGCILAEKYGDTVTIKLLSVHYGHHGFGVASELVGSAERWASDHRSAIIEASIRTSGQRRNVYSRCGWDLGQEKSVNKFGQRFQLQTWEKLLHE